MTEYTKPKADAARVLSQVYSFLAMGGSADRKFWGDDVAAQARMAERQRRVGVIQLLNNRLGGNKAKDYIYSGYAGHYEFEMDLYRGTVAAPANYPWWPDDRACDKVMPLNGAEPCPFCGSMTLMETFVSPELTRFAVQVYCADGAHSLDSREDVLGSDLKCPVSPRLVANSPDEALKIWNNRPTLKGNTDNDKASNSERRERTSGPEQGSNPPVGDHPWTRPHGHYFDPRPLEGDNEHAGRSAGSDRGTAERGHAGRGGTEAGDEGGRGNDTWAEGDRIKDGDGTEWTVGRVYPSAAGLHRDTESSSELPRAEQTDTGYPEGRSASSFDSSDSSGSSTD